MSTSVSREESQPMNIGRIEGLAVPIIIGSVHKTGTTGVLHFTRGNVRKSLYFKDGDLIFATSSDNNDRLGDLLIKKGKVSDCDLEEAVSKLGTGKKLGALLTENRKMTPEDLVEAIVEQIKNIVFSIFEWERGFYQYEEGKLPTQELITLNQSTPEILFQGVRRMSDLKILLRALGGFKRKYVLDANHQEKIQTYLISDEEKKIAELLKEPASAEEILKAASLNTLEVIRTLVAMKIIGLINEVASPIIQAFQKDSPFKGDLVQEDIIDILGFLARDKRVGSFYIRSEPIEIGMFLKEGDLLSLYVPQEKISFFQFLSWKKAEQKDSLQGKEQTSQRPKGGERTHIKGTPSKNPLGGEEESFSLKILHDILMLDEGEYIFLEGQELPKSEIPVKKSMREILLNVMGEMTDRSRIERGCGGEETWLILTPSYLEVMDQMPIDNQFWDMISKLQAPCAVKELLSSFPIDDLELRRWLWIMQVMGVIKKFEEEEEEEKERPVVAQPAKLEKKEFHESSEESDGTWSRPLVEKEKADKDPLLKPRQGPSHGKHQLDSLSLDEEWKELIRERHKELEEPKGSKSSHTSKVRKKQTPSKVDAASQAKQEKRETDAAGEKERPIDEKLIEAIRKFNEKQKYLFEKLKSEMGAGTQNFIHYCQSQVAGESNSPFTDMSLTSSGDWDPSSLARKIMKNHIDQYENEFEKLLNVELEMVGNFLSPKKMQELKRGIQEIRKRHMKIE